MLYYGEGQGKEKGHNDERGTTKGTTTATNVTAPPTTAASSCSRGGNGEQGDGKRETRMKTGE